MITEIHMEGVASFKGPTSLHTDKKVNLIYGLNGTGKSTLSNFLYDQTDPKFAKCRKAPEQANSIFVYNQKFIQDNFFVADSLKGIFSLSKENKAAEEKISKAETALTEINQRLQSKQSKKQNISQTFSKQKQSAIDEVWKIKTTYTGGDRVLEYCIEGLKGQKEKLFEHLLSIVKPFDEPQKTISILKDEVEALKGDAAHSQTELPKLEFAAHNVESNAIYGKAIVGNEDSEVAALIEGLGNSDWVKQGLEYLPEHLDEHGQACPFCQESTITQALVANIKGYFDETYQSEITTLESLQKRYKEAIDSLSAINTYTGHPFAAEKNSAITQKYQTCKKILDDNLRAIDAKLKNPRLPQKISDSLQAFEYFNEVVVTINDSIKAFNIKLENRETALDSLKNEFWQILRWQYDQTISRYKKDLEVANSQSSSIDKEIIAISNEIIAQKKCISDAQKETVNVEEAVIAINSGLLNLGIDDFEIVNHAENLYRVVRHGESEDAFHTLSEGEKMMISFLYFCELCKGKTSADDTATQLIAVIDDPISSLSHVFIFNVGQLIKSVFFKSGRFSQVFVLTHSLYFFYELTDPNHDRRKMNQNLFRMSKIASGSKIQEMKYEEIQNDYQAYWSVINDPDQPPGLIANCMRNIVEYFFNFVRRKDLNNVFQMPELQDAKFQAFCRYVNRESHSSGQNIFDMKEFDYEVFKEGLRLIFEATGYPDHFKEMSKC